MLPQTKDNFKIGFKMARRNKSLDTAIGFIIVGLIALGFIVQVIEWLFTFLKENPVLPILVVAIIGLYFFIQIRQKRTVALRNEKRWQKEEREAEEIRKKIALEAQAKRKKLLKELNKVVISDKRGDYIIKKEDYKRGNKRESEYRKQFLLPLLGLYENKCAKCGDSNNGFDLDHFVFSKNEGGNFALLHKDGHLINNAIPLCQTCNRSKGDRSYKDFFSEDELLYCFRKNKDMTLKLNKET